MKGPILALLVFVAPTAARAIWNDFSPFNSSDPPTRFPLRVLNATWQSGEEYRAGTENFSRADEKQPCLEIDWEEVDGRVKVMAASGDVIFSAPLIGSTLCGAEICEADLNGDCLPDYVIVTHSGGNGLAAQYTHVTFVLSSLKGYTAHTILSYDAAPIDLVDLNGDGRPEFVHCMCVYGDFGKDGRSHNYWVYNLLGFNGTEIVSANLADRRFPKWVMYAWEPNHSETRQLSADQREKQWLKAWEWEEIVSRGQPVFPNVVAFGKEQRRNALVQP